ncbi:hypothetical protein B0H10DRAFT_1956143 [Mycena sp. CBHHK59/15]|nr:hypothetical protein B0H10DRAFT_1956143 [Mycena sp. CBHHK59/15]
MSTATLPPFPDDVPTHPLLVIDYELVKVKDAAEIKRLWTAGTELGFWYLKNHGVEEEANGMFEMATETMGLPMVEKMKYEQGDGGMSFGPGANAVDGSGKKDTVQSINISTDDVLAYPQQAHRAYPSTVNAGIARTITPFQRDLGPNLHRVVSPPGAQNGLEHQSLVYFTRPVESVVLRALVDESPPIADAVVNTPDPNFETGATAWEWFARRIEKQRVNNRKGPEMWMESRIDEIQHTHTHAEGSTFSGVHSTFAKRPHIFLAHYVTTGSGPVQVHCGEPVQREPSVLKRSIRVFEALKPNILGTTCKGLNKWTRKPKSPRQTESRCPEEISKGDMTYRYLEAIKQRQKKKLQLVLSGVPDLAVRAGWSW